VAAADLMGGDIGLTLLVGVPVAVVSWFFGAYLVGTYLGRRYDIAIPTAIFGEMNTNQPGKQSGSQSGSRPGDGDEADHAATGDTAGPGGTTTTTAAPPFGTVLMILLLPLVLISLNTIVSTLQVAGTIGDEGVWDVLMLIGQTPIALLITVLAALFVLS